MTRFLFWLALAFLVLFAIRSKIRGLQQRGRSQQQQQPPHPFSQAGRRVEELPDAEQMLCCAHCGVYYPASENVAAKGHNYCSHAHATV